MPVSPGGPIVDAHVHLGEGYHLSLGVDELLGRMDEAGVERAVACPVDHFVAVHNREGNDLMLDAVRSHGDRLSGMAAANPWFGDQAVEEARRALGEGLSGLFVHSVYQGFRLDDHIVDPLLEGVAEFGVPVYVHTGTAAQAEPFQATELARRFPELNFIMGHGGSSDYGEDAVRALEFAPHPHRLFPFATVPLMWPEKRVREMIERALGELGFYGLKFVSICQGVSLATPSMDLIAREAIRFGVPVFLHDGSPEYCSAIQVVYYARKYPELRVVSGHGGLREFWPEYIDGVRELPNLQVCLSGPTQWGIQTLYDELGPDRLMFGSDGGIGSHAITRAYLRRLARLEAPEDDKRKIMGISGMRFLFGEDWEKVIAEK